MAVLNEDTRRILSESRFRHRVHVADGVYTVGKVDVENGIATYNLPEDFFQKKTVLDIGAWSGGFSFLFERRGATVTALDVMDPVVSGFNTLKIIMGSKAKFAQKSVYDLDPKKDGPFDAVFYQGTFYHLKHPILALDKINAVMKPGGTIFGGGTSADSYFNHQGKVVNVSEIAPQVNEMPMSFFVRDDFLGDKSNWWIPNGACVEAWLKRSGFTTDRIWTRSGGKSLSGEPRSVTRFLARKTSDPEPEHPF